jgi:hypothetical protein
MTGDMDVVTAPKSDQINAEDLLGGRTMTITVERVQVRPGTEQPVTIWFTGSQKVFRPCKGVSKILKTLWGPDSAQYVGRSMTLFNDESVTWAGAAVGGIRVSAMSHIDDERRIPVAISKAKKKFYPIKPLRPEIPMLTNRQPEMTAEEWTERFERRVAEATDHASLALVQEENAKSLAALGRRAPLMGERAKSAIAKRLAELSNVS